ACPRRMMGWTPLAFRAKLALWSSLAWGSGLQRKETDMNATTVAVDLAKSVFQVAVADASGRIASSHRLTRTQFERFFDNRVTGLVAMEACGSAHHSARSLQSQGISVRLLPPSRGRRYCRRNKTDAADCAALLEANRNPK